METDPQSASIFTQLLILLVLTLIRGYFAGAEMAVASVNKNKIHRLKEQGNKKAALIERLMEGSTAFLSAIQLIVTLAGFLSSAVAATGISGILAVKMNRWGIPGSKIAAVVVITLILVYVNLVFGELIPKRMALQNAEKFSLSCIGLVYFVSCIVKPFVGLLNISTSGILKLFGMHHENLETDVSEEEIKSLLETGSETGVFNEIEKEMITSIFSFDDKKAKEVMVPRQDMVAIDIDEPVDSYLDDILQSMHSKIPVYQEDIDNIIGILSTKALTIEARKKSFENLDIRSLLTPAYFVPENRRTDALFREMQQKKEKELSDREAVITRKELMAEAKNTLVEKKLPVSLAEVLNYADADTCNKSISAVEKAFQEAVEAAVNERLKGGTPPKKAPQENVTKETYAKMGYTERLKLKTENPELYKQLAGK